MENFQHKINLMKQQINTIRSDIESIATETNNHITSTHYSTPSNPLFPPNSNHKSHSPIYNKPTIKTKYTHRKNSYNHHSNLLINNNVHHHSDYILTNRNDILQRKLPIASGNSMYMNLKMNKPNENINTRHKKGKSVIMPNSSRHYNENRFDVNSNDIVKELIDITNEYCCEEMLWKGNECVDITPEDVVENYKRLLKENKMYMEFIKEVAKLYKNKMGYNCNMNTNNNTNNIIIDLWKWINYMAYNDNNKYNSNFDSNSNNNNKYQQYCERIMYEHNLQTFNDFTSFINHLLNKSNKNETFLDGIKKLLLVPNKIEAYP